MIPEKEHAAEWFAETWNMWLTPFLGLDKGFSHSVVKADIYNVIFALLSLIADFIKSQTI